ncbi:MAG: DUF1294 domain-containing protein [Lentisphaeria bacterium]
MRKFKRILLVVVFVLPFAFSSIVSGKNQAPLFLYMAMSVVTFLAYGSDKIRSVRKSRRLPEKWLHGSGLFFGWPGSIAGIYLFNHKKYSGKFCMILVVTVVMHLVIWFNYFL